MAGSLTEIYNAFVIATKKAEELYLASSRLRDLGGVIKSLNGGADIEGRHFGYTPLMGAAEYGNIEIVELLIMRGADINAFEYTKKRTNLIKSDEGPMVSISRKVGFGSTALMLAAKNGHDEVVKLLLQHGAAVNARTMGSETGATALHHATK